MALLWSGTVESESSPGAGAAGGTGRGATAATTLCAMTDQIVSWVETLMTLPVFYPVLGLVVIIDSLFPLVPSETSSPSPGRGRVPVAYPTCSPSSRSPSSRR